MNPHWLSKGVKKGWKRSGELISFPWVYKKASLIWPHDLGIISLDLTPYLTGTECSIFFYVFNFREAVGNQSGIMGDYNP